ncbi:FkbM family methyltransferase [Azospirillum sp. sgz301742]
MHRLTLEDFLAYTKKLGFSPKTCIDVGAANGTTCIYRTYSKSRHILFEALQEFEPDLRRICSQYDAEFVLGAAGAKPGSVTFNVHKDLFGSSLLSEEEGKQVDGEARKVPMFTVDGVCEKLQTEGPYLLKIDVQGAELEVIRGAKRVLEQTEVVILETSLFNFFKNGPLLSDVISAMDKLGLVPYDIFGQLYRLVDGALAQVDVAFVKRDGIFRTTHVYATPEQRRAQDAAMAGAFTLSTARATTSLPIRPVLSAIGTALLARGVAVEIPSEALVDLSTPFVGTNWYSPEDYDGRRFRWSGPGTASTIDLVVRRDQDLAIRVDVFTAASPDLLRDLKVEVDGQSIALIVQKVATSYVLKGVVPAIAAGEVRSTRVTFIVPYVVTPTTGDVRQLGLAVERISLSCVKGGNDDGGCATAEKLTRLTLPADLKRDVRGALDLFLREMATDYQPLTPELFDEAYYLAENPDVCEAIREGGFGSGYEHYEMHGQYEARPFRLKEDTREQTLITS